MYIHMYFTISHAHTGMAGKDEVANAVLGGASDFMSDIWVKIIHWYFAKDDQKVVCLWTCITMFAIASYVASYSCNYI